MIRRRLLLQALASALGGTLIPNQLRLLAATTPVGLLDKTTEHHPSDRQSPSGLPSLGFWTFDERRLIGAALNAKDASRNVLEVFDGQPRRATLTLAAAGSAAVDIGTTLAHNATLTTDVAVRISPRPEPFDVADIQFMIVTPDATDDDVSLVLGMLTPLPLPLDAARNSPPIRIAYLPPPELTAGARPIRSERYGQLRDSGFAILDRIETGSSFRESSLLILDSILAIIEVLHGHSPIGVDFADFVSALGSRQATLGGALRLPPVSAFARGPLEVGLPALRQFRNAHSMLVSVRASDAITMEHYQHINESIHRAVDTCNTKICLAISDDDFGPGIGRCAAIWMNSL